MEREPIAEYFRLALEETLGPVAQRGVQARIAATAGISPSYLNDILKGRTDGSEDVRRAISKAIGQSYEQMIDRGRVMRRVSVEGPTLSANETVNRDIQWILTRKRPASERKSDKPATLNTDLLRKIILEVETGASGKGIVLDPAKKARLIAILYEHSVSSGRSIGKKTVENYLDLLS